MVNFNPARLSQNPYPVNNRPRGKADLDSVSHHRRLIRKDEETAPIWVAQKGGEYILLDGAHRIVAYYLENKRQVPCCLITIN